MSTENSIGIYMAGLDPKETAVFTRVIAFNETHGLIQHRSENASSADLIILSESNYSEFSSSNQDQVLLIISNDVSCEIGDFQTTRPLLITRVMKTLQQAIDLAVLKSTLKNNTVDEEESLLNHSTVIAQDTCAKPIVETTPTIIEKSHIIEAPQNSHHALVIDDSAAIRKQLELELRDANISADFAESGEQALEMIQTTQYDLVFLDIIMPGIDGYETCKSMRLITDYKKTPIIMLSGKTSPLDEVQGVIAGATTYLTKPVKSDKLQETLNRVTKWLENFNTSKEKATA
jgi:CheY-like chemotaxis protein